MRDYVFYPLAAALFAGLFAAAMLPIWRAPSPGAAAGAEAGATRVVFDADALLQLTPHEDHPFAPALDRDRALTGVKLVSLTPFVDNAWTEDAPFLAIDPDVARRFSGRPLTLELTAKDLVYGPRPELGLNMIVDGEESGWIWLQIANDSRRFDVPLAARGALGGGEDAMLLLWADRLGRGHGVEIAEIALSGLATADELREPGTPGT